MADSVYGGTWAGESVPAELRDYELMRAMKWSWTELQETPLYVRRYCWDLHQARLKAEQDRIEASRPRGERGHAG